MLNIDYKKCEKVVKILNDHYENEEKVADIEYPSIIEYGTNEYYLYMLYSCLLDYGTRSKAYHKNLSNTYIKYPNIFNPSYVCKMSEESLKEIVVNNIHPRYPSVATKKWISVSNELLKYDSFFDYLKKIKSFDELNRLILNFKGFGQKTGGLLVRIICDSKVCDFDARVKSIPIDRHDIEISYLTDIIDTKKLSKLDIISLSDTYVKCAKKLNINPSSLDKYLWEVGNTYCNKKNCNMCPLKSVCNKRNYIEKIKENKLHKYQLLSLQLLLTM